MTCCVTCCASWPWRSNSLWLLTETLIARWALGISVCSLIIDSAQARSSCTRKHQQHAMTKDTLHIVLIVGRHTAHYLDGRSKLALLHALPAVQALSSAEQLVVGSINFVSAARNALLELHAWRCMQQLLQPSSGHSLPSASNDRYLMSRSVALRGLHILDVQHVHAKLCSVSVFLCAPATCNDL